MKLEHRNNYGGQEFVCDLTRELDIVSGIADNQHYRLFHHYVLADEWCMNNKCLAIRVPGGTVGGIWIDKNNMITKIVIDTNYVVKTYPDDVNDLMEKYIRENINEDKDEYELRFLDNNSTLAWVSGADLILLMKSE